MTNSEHAGKPDLDLAASMPVFLPNTMLINNAQPRCARQQGRALRCPGGRRDPPSR
ncbi:hypothetical protein [Paracoccus sp. AK26]|uniref:hypothetical protein n=1 Tax=Paracoccus sp. AK26 TaxID=2589076 RepID=UPI0014308789|nr:hypothetical protein [Paracoccus sp. AK26]